MFQICEKDDDGEEEDDDEKQKKKTKTIKKMMSKLKMIALPTGCMTCLGQSSCNPTTGTTTFGVDGPCMS